MELPTPSNADSPKQKKHREQAIVAGTLVLVILTFVIVMRRGSSASVGSGAPGFTPTDSGASTPDPLGTLPAQVGAIPGQVDALEAGRFGKLNSRLNAQAKKLAALRRQNKRILTQEQKLRRELRADEHPAKHGHPKAPKKTIHVTTHAPHLTNPRAPHRPVHPPQHHQSRSHPVHVPHGA